MPLLFRLMKQAQFVPACGAAQGALGIFPFQQVFDKFDALSYNRAQSSFPRKAASLLFFLSLAIGFCASARGDGANDLDQLPCHWPLCLGLPIV